MRRIIWCLIGIIASGVAVTHAQEPPPSRACPTQEKARQAPDYKIARTLDFRSSKHHPLLELFLSVEPEHVNSDEMTALAAQLNRDFCQESRLYVRILDDYQIATNWLPVAHQRAVFARAWRGEYYLNRTTGEEWINFSTTRGKPIKEVKINLGHTKPPKPATRHRVRRKPK